jgi:hypothetical protein
MKRLLILMMVAVLTTASQAAVYTWDGGTGNWEDSNWSGGQVALELDGFAPSAQSYDYDDDAFTISAGGDVSSAERVTLAGGSLAISGATATFNSTGSYSGLNLGHAVSTSGNPTIASFTDSTVNVSAVGNAGRALYLKNDATLTVTNSTVNTFGTGSKPWVEVDDGVLSLVESIVNTDVIRLDGKIANDSWIEFTSGTINTSSANAFRGDSFSASKFTFNGAAGQAVISSAGQTTAAKELAHKVFQGLFFIDDTRITTTTDYIDVSSIAAMNSELASQAVAGRILQLTDDGAGNQTLYITTVPEPTTMALLGLGGLLLRKRRK